MDSKAPQGLLGVLPEGILLDFKADLSRDMGVAYERSLYFEKGNHSHPRMVICAARGATRAEIRQTDSDQRYLNQAGVVVVKPAGFRHSVHALTTVYEDLALLPTVELVQNEGEKAGFSKSQLRDFLNNAREVRRSAWLEQLLEQYFVRRLLQEAQPPELEFFEKEILRELIFLAVGFPDAQASQSLRLPGPLRRSLDLIEANLFNEISVESIAKDSGQSASTLLRLFKHELKMSPRDYIRDRRLDEARRLLQNSERSVMEVAQLVGYMDASAFSRAYRKRFKISPRRE